VEIEVCGAKTEKAARLVAESIACSPLFKAAIYGRSTNWGRIMCAVGNSKVKTDPKKIDISFGSVKVVINGTGSGYDEKEAAGMLSKKEINVKVNLKAGKESIKVYTCDLTPGYVDINAGYKT
jgi:glutamate N-acetyltransferase/amino-acid N-acetyltransferase